MNEDNISKSEKSHISIYTPIKIKSKENLYNKKNFLFRTNTPYIYSNYINQNNKNNNKTNKFSKSEIENPQNVIKINSNDYTIKILYESINNSKKRKSFSTNSHPFNINNCSKNKSNKKKTILNPNYLKQKNLFTYNFIKDTQRIDCSTIIFKRKNNKSNYNSTYNTHLLTESNNSKYLNDNKKLKKFLIKNKLNNMSKIKYNSKNNNEINERNKNKKNYKSINNNNIDKNKININVKKKLVNSPESIFYYIINYINGKKKENNLDQRIYFSRIKMEKKFRYYKKDLEKIEQKTNFELYNLKRQIAPSRDNKLTMKLLSNI